ncbi:hypothetical protein Tco_1091982 [Tanacetum coccineum]|uniref:Uncharacterized protein n=1 Tax=Tanacetum coccineum TaxID=301880 RepID=A0ABQ5I9S6_9ASTR
MRTKTELALEQTQQGASDEVLNIRGIPYSIYNDDGNPTSANIKQALRQVSRWQQHLVHDESNSQPHAHTQRSKVSNAPVMRTASAAVKPCQGDSLKLYMITSSNPDGGCNWLKTSQDS